MTIQFNTPAVSSNVSLATAACLVMWNVSQWTARKKDQGAANKLAADNNANSAALSVHKRLVNMPEFDAINKHVGWVRNNFHYPQTLPWSDSGMRLCPTADLFTYKPEMERHGQEFERLVNVFLSVYAEAVRRGKAQLGSMFDESQYPSVDEVASKFSWRTTFIPVPTSGDFRVDVSDIQRDNLAAEYEDFYQAEMKSAMDKIWSDLHVALSELVVKLDFDGKKKNKLFASRLDSIKQLIRLLDTCNFTGDPKMSDMQIKLASTFDGLTVEQLRHSEVMRERTAASLEDALSKMPSLDF